MPLPPPITDVEQLKNHPAIARLLAWNPQVVEGVKFDRDQMTIYVERSAIREACVLLKEDPACPFNAFSDLTCVDWYPSEQALNGQAGSSFNSTQASRMADRS